MYVSLPVFWDNAHRLKEQNLERCYGVKKDVADCDWQYLKTLRTTQAPHLPLPRFVDVLEYLRQPGLGHIWAFLDIKVLNSPIVLFDTILTHCSTLRTQTLL